MKQARAIQKVFRGKPAVEPVAWYGSIVMNTREELEVAFEEYQSGTFIKHRRA
jgi:redox-sensitive bicupin YhaK (pirin superfamily)